MWGSGFIAADRRFRGRTAHVFALRGPLTAAILRGQGIPCPDRFGDPALLVPLLHPRPAARADALGLIPHFIERNDPRITNLAQQLGAKVLDIRGPLTKFLDELWTCDSVISSSLHGLVLADSYRIPNVWLQLSDRVLGDGFKFRDYFASVGREARNLDLRREPMPSPRTIRSLVEREPLRVDLGGLVAACPWPVATRSRWVEAAANLSEELAAV